MNFYVCKADELVTQEVEIPQIVISYDEERNASRKAD